MLTASMRVFISAAKQGLLTMSHELAKKPTNNNAVATRSEEVENIAAAAKKDAGLDRRLKFKKGGYVFDDKTTVPLGSQYLLHATAWLKSWTKFIDGEFVEQKLYRVANGEQPPEREELDDLDQSSWKSGIDGKPSDPWILQYMVPLEDLSSGDVVVFTSQSKGGHRAISDICGAYAKRCKRGVFGQPIVKLGCTMMPTKKFGDVQRPSFEVVRWDDGEPAQNDDDGAADFSDAVPF
jgi:hypothetical protein